jgi:4-amino-4-deoxy-L-arabinose transferase-like glycosyltransferase
MTRKNFIALFTIALLIRCALFIFISSQPIRFYSNSDTYNYEQIALNLLKYGVFSGDAQPPLTPNLYRTPVYPLFLAGIYTVTHNSAHVVILLHILIGSFASAAMLWLTDSLKLSPRIGWIAGLVVALDPLITLTTYQMITETLFLGLLIPAIAMFALYFKSRNSYWLAGSAILLALVSLTRPISQYLPIALIPLFFIVATENRRSQVVKNLLLFLVINLVITSSWAYRNYSETGVWTLSAISNKNLIYYRARAILAEGKNISEDEAYQELSQYIQTESQSRNLTTAQQIELMDARAMEVFRQYPVATLKVHLKGLAIVTVNPGVNLFCIMLDDQSLQLDDEDNVVGCTSQSDGFIAETRDKLGQMNWFGQLVSLFEIVLMAGLYLGSAIGVWKLFREKQWYLLFLLMMLITYFLLLSAGGESVSRFRIPIIPFLAILAGIGFSKSYLLKEEAPAVQGLKGASAQKIS